MVNHDISPTLPTNHAPYMQLCTVLNDSKQKVVIIIVR